MNSLVEFIRALGPTRLAAMGAVTAVMIGFFAYLMFQMSQPKMTVLFTDLQFEDSAAIIKKLEGMNVPHEVRQEGAIILVPQEQVLKLRMKLAEERLPAGGGVGYEIFDKGDNLGATSFVQSINHLRAIEGELARTIKAIDRIQMARVHLVLPQRELFARKKAEPSASIVVRVRGSLESGQIRAIQHLVSAAVEGLKPGRVSIVDESGKLLAAGTGDDENAVASEAVDERNRSFEQRLQKEIEEIVSNVVGMGKVRARVTAELDYNKITQTSETYDPDGQVVRSTKTFSEASASSQPTGDNSVSVSNELPAAGNNSSNSKTEKENAQKTEEVVNYEISKTNKTEVVEAGRIKKISVAVLVDGVYGKGADGKSSYTARTQAEIDEITQLVRTAIGFDNTRGDKVYVSNLRFMETEIAPLDAPTDSGLFNFSKEDYFNIAELLVTFLIGSLVLLFVIRPLINRIITPEETIFLVEEDEPAGPQLDAQTQQLLEKSKPLLDENGEPIQPNKAAIQMLQNAKLSGEIQASFIREVGELVQNNPNEAVAVIRNWIQSDVIQKEEEAA